MITIRPELTADIAPRERLLDRAFGKKRFAKTSERLREGRLAAEGLAFSAIDEKGKLVGTLRLWDVIAGSAGRALLLGPLAVDCKAQRKGIGAALMRHAIAEATHRAGGRGHRSIFALVRNGVGVAVAARAGRDGFAVTLAEYNQHTTCRIIQRALRLDTKPPIEVFSNDKRLLDLNLFL